jgi:hypothetical protein
MIFVISGATMCAFWSSSKFLTTKDTKGHKGKT